VTNEQRDVIRALFGHYDWKLDKILLEWTIGTLCMVTL
jgi:hypothetical protein